jgi:hypothetical protein
MEYRPMEYLAHSVIHLFTTSPNAEVRYFSEHFFSLPVGGRGLGADCTDYWPGPPTGEMTSTDTVTTTTSVWCLSL